MVFRTHSRDDESVLPILLSNLEVSISVRAANGLDLVLPDSLFYQFIFHGNDVLWYMEYTILPAYMTGLHPDMVGWLNLLADGLQFLPRP